MVYVYTGTCTWNRSSIFEILKIAKPWPSLSHRPCIHTRFRICLRQLWTTYHVIAQVGVVNMCACVEPVGTAIGAVCVEYGWPKWPITMLNHTHIPGTEDCFVFYFWHHMVVRPVKKRLLSPWKSKEKKARVARAPHDKDWKRHLWVWPTTEGALNINITWSYMCLRFDVVSCRSFG